MAVSLLKPPWGKEVYHRAFGCISPLRYFAHVAKEITALVLVLLYISDLDSSWYLLANSVKITIIQWDLRLGKSGTGF